MLKQILAFCYVFYLSVMKCGVWLRVFGSAVTLALLLLTTGYFVLMHRVETHGRQAGTPLQARQAASFVKTYPRPKYDPVGSAAQLSGQQHGVDNSSTGLFKSKSGVAKLDFAPFNASDLEATLQHYKRKLNLLLALNRTQIVPGDLALALLLKRMQDGATKTSDVSRQDDVTLKWLEEKKKKVLAKKDDSDDEDDD